MYAYQDLLVSINANQSTDSYRDSFGLRGAVIKNYNRISKNYTTNILFFDVVNNWNSGYVNWSISTPSIKNSTYLLNNDSIMVFVEYQYPQGTMRPEINVTTSTYVDRIRECFSVRPLEMMSLLALTESKNNSVSEFVVKNNLNSTQIISWRFHDGLKFIYSNQTLPLNASESILVFIATNYSDSNVYETYAYANTSAYFSATTSVILT